MVVHKVHRTEDRTHLFNLTNGKADVKIYDYVAYSTNMLQKQQTPRNI